jgi:hypothetical protein
VGSGIFGNGYGPSVYDIRLALPRAPPPEATQQPRRRRRSYAAVPTQFSTVATPPTPEAKYLDVGLRRPCSVDARRNIVNILDLIFAVKSSPAMAWTALHLRHTTSVWASWLPHWPTCMCAISREDSN